MKRTMTVLHCSRDVGGMRPQIWASTSIFGYNFFTPRLYGIFFIFVLKNKNSGNTWQITCLSKTVLGQDWDFYNAKYLINMHNIDSTCLSEVVKRSIKLPYLYLVRWSIWGTENSRRLIPDVGSLFWWCKVFGSESLSSSETSSLSFAASIIEHSSFSRKFVNRPTMHTKLDFSFGSHDKHNDEWRTLP